MEFAVLDQNNDESGIANCREILGACAPTNSPRPYNLVPDGNSVGLSVEVVLSVFSMIAEGAL